MSGSELPGVSPFPPKPPLREKVTRLFARKKLPGWVFIAYLVIQGVPDWKSRFDFWLDAAKTAGGYTAQMAMVIASPNFSLAMAAIGVLWLVFAGEPKHAALRDPRWIYFGWSMVAALLLVLGITLINGYFEMRIRQAIAWSPLAISVRHLSDAEKACLNSRIPTLVLGNRKIGVGAVNGDREGMHYAGEFINIFADANVLDDATNPKRSRGDRFAVSLTSNDPTSHGVLVAVPNKDQPTQDAQSLHEILYRCGIATSFVSMDRAQDKLWLVIDQPP